MLKLLLELMAAAPSIVTTVQAAVHDLEAAASTDEKIKVAVTALKEIASALEAVL